MEVQLYEYREKMSQVNELLAYTKKLEDEKALLQTKVSDILNNPDKLEFL